MNKKIAKELFTIIATSIVCIGIGLIIWNFNKESMMSLQNILFWVGAIPITIFAVGLVGNYTGALNPSNRSDLPLIEQSLKERAKQSESDFRFRVASGLKWIIAGLIVWAISYYV